MICSAYNLRPFSSCTPTALPSSTRISFTVVFSHKSTCSCCNFRRKAFTISLDWSDTGNTLCPRSTFSGTPASSKNACTCVLENRLKAVYKNFPLCKKLAIISSRSLAVVTLQRPFPLMSIFLPSRSFFSKSVTVAPCSAAVMAAIIPLAPPPIINTCCSIICPLHFPNLSCFILRSCK